MSDSSMRGAGPFSSFVFSFTALVVCLLLSACDVFSWPVVSAWANSHKAAARGSTPCYQTTNPAQAAWVDSVMGTMSVEARIGQLLMVAAYSNKDEAHLRELLTYVEKYKIGGVIFFQGGPHRQAKMTNTLQAASALPLMVGIDGEWGLQMRLQDSTIAYPRQMTLGAHADETLIKKMGVDIARQCRRMGIHVNFAPVVDVNSNPANPVIGMRSFGENKENVALKSIAYMQGMQQNGVLACAKHFPGHGDSDADSHFSLPSIKHPRKRLEEVELYPFRRLMGDSLASVMVAHLLIPALDKTANRPSTLSRAIVTDLLRSKMGFKGLAFTDALNMKGAANFAKPGQLEVMALEAGNDVLLFPENVPAAVESIKNAIDKKEIRQSEVDAHVRRILMAKWWCGLSRKPEIALDNLYQDLNTGQTRALVASSYRAAITFARNQRNLLPFKNLDTMDFASLALGPEETNAFQKQLSKYANFAHFQLPAQAKGQVLNNIAAKLGPGKKTLVVSLHKISAKQGLNYGISAELVAWLTEMQTRHRVVVVAFGNPYSLKVLTTLSTVVCAFEDNATAQSVAAQALFGAGATSGRLPVTLAANIPEGSGSYQADAKRVGFGVPEEVGIDSRKLSLIDSMAQRIVNRRITPGCQVLVARRGKIIYEKSFGHMSYRPLDSTSSWPDTVQNESMYDIASITKVAGTLQVVMFLYERGQLDVTKPLATYMPELAGTPKADLVIADILSHQAGLQPFIPFWRRTLGKGRVAQLRPGFEGPVISGAINQCTGTTAHLSDVFYCDEPDGTNYVHQVAPGVFAKNDVEDSLWKWTMDAPLMRRNKRGTYDYKYSDMGFYIMKRLCERLINQPIEDFLDQNLYQPLGLQTMCYRPLEWFEPSRIAPTETDTYFRKTLVRGTVHDQGAAMLGGVGGHAGLFSNALDLAVLMQMNMQDGEYGGQKFFQKGTVPYFAKAHFPRNRRGLGWDKPIPRGDGPTAPQASMQTFGHTGFTGTCAWADPKEQIVFIFLSNRTFPHDQDNRLVSESIRPRMQELIYKAMTDSSVGSM